LIAEAAGLAAFFIAGFKSSTRARAPAPHEEEVELMLDRTAEGGCPHVSFVD